MMQQTVCHIDDMQPGELREAELGRISIVVCKTPDGAFYAFSNKCIHQGGPLSKGKLCGAPQSDSPGEYTFCQDGEILRCPWHGREFNVKDDGRMLANPAHKLPSFPIKIENDYVIVYK